MELWQALAARTTVRSFESRPVPDTVLDRALRAALHAPAYNHLWEWGFIRVCDGEARHRLVEALGVRDWTDREHLRRMFDPLPEEARKVYLAACPVQRRMMLSAPELLVVVYRTKLHESNPASPADLNAHAAIWMGIAYLLLALAEEGVHGCTAPPGPTAAARPLLELPPDWEIATLLPIGYPRSRPRRRPHPVDPAPFLHLNTFGGFSLPTTPEQMG